MDGASGEIFGTMTEKSLMTGESCGGIYIAEITVRRARSSASCDGNIGM